jgi:hypothetical protein
MVTATVRPSRSWSHARFRAWRSSVSEKRLSSTVTGATSASGGTDSRTALIVPSPASATSAMPSAPSARARSTVSPSLASGERAPPAPSTSPTSTPSGQVSSLASSPIVNGGRPSASAAIGGAIAASYQRWGAHTARGSSSVATASTSASVPSSSTANDCTGLRAATTRPRAMSSAARRAATQVLPISVPVPVTTTRRRGRVTCPR